METETASANAATDEATAPDAAEDAAPVEEAEAPAEAEASEETTETAMMSETDAGPAEENSGADESAADTAPVEESETAEASAADAAPAEEEAPQAAAESEFVVAYQDADAAAGERVYRQCQACHVADREQNRVGPHLVGIVGRPIGSIDGFRYSGALPDGEWTLDNLNAWLENPRGFAQGTSMSYAGLRDMQDRANVIAYIESLN
jgi:cytochrome c2